MTRQRFQLGEDLVVVRLKAGPGHLPYPDFYLGARCVPIKIYDFPKWGEHGILHAVEVIFAKGGKGPVSMWESCMERYNPPSIGDFEYRVCAPHGAHRAYLPKGFFDRPLQEVAIKLGMNNDDVAIGDLSRIAFKDTMCLLVGEYVGETKA